MIRIQGLKGCCEGEAFEFPTDRVVSIGRGSRSQLVVDDPSCSRRHAEIKAHDGGYVLRDLGSTNGVRVNGQAVKEARLGYGDRFSIGRNLFIFLADVGAEREGDDSAVIDDTVAVTDLENRMTRDITELTQRQNYDAISPEELEELQRTHKQMHFVYRMSRAINSTLDQDGLFDLICRSIFEDFRGVDRVSIFIADPDDPAALEEVRREIREEHAGIDADWDTDWPSTVSSSILKRVERERIGVLAGSSNVGSATDKQLPCMCAPMLVGARFVGSLYLESRSHMHTFGKADLELLTVLANQSATAIGNALLYKELQVSFYEAVRGLSNALEAKDQYTRGHSDRVAKYSVGIGRELGLDEDRLRILRVAAELHDIGKIAITEAIIGKSGALTDEEYDLIKKHPELGIEIIRPIRFLKPALPIILHHHERWNGEGYPSGLRGQQIPLEARILNLADAFDAMTTQRAYNKPLSVIQALEHCRAQADISFDPECVEAFVRFLMAATENEEDAETGTVHLSVAGMVGT